MTTDRETTRIVRSWMQLGVDQLPERVLDAVLDELPATPQRRSWRPAWRSLQMPNVIKLAAVAVAVLLVAVVGFQLLPARGGIGGPAATPTPTPAPTLAPSPSPTPSPARTPIPIGANSLGHPLVASAYHVPAPFIAPFTVSFPTPWTVYQLGEQGLFLARSQPADFAPAIEIDRVDSVFADPCHPTDPSPSASTQPLTADEIVTALTSLKDFTAGPVTNVTLGGHAARSFELTNAITDEAAAKCTGSPLDIWRGSMGTINSNQRARDHFWVVDMNGTPLTIDAVTIPGMTPPDMIAEADAVVGSIQFDQ